MIRSTGIWRDETSSANTGATVWSRAFYASLYCGGVHARQRIPNSGKERLQCS